MAPPQPQVIGAQGGALVVALEAFRRWFEAFRARQPAREAQRRAFVERLGRTVHAFASSIVNFGRRQQRTPRAARPMRSTAIDRPRRWRVRVHVYQLVGDRTQRLCKAAGVGGLYHTGVEVGGVEYGYGCHDEACTGVWKQLPRQLPRDFARGRAVHTAVIEMGEIELTARQLHSELHEVMEAFPGNGYSVLHRNCNHFTIELCQRLVHRAPPAWINAAAGKGARLHLAVGAASSRVTSINSGLRRACPKLPALSKRLAASHTTKPREASARALRWVLVRERSSASETDDTSSKGAGAAVTVPPAAGAKPCAVRRAASAGKWRERVRVLRRPSCDLPGDDHGVQPGGDAHQDSDTLTRRRSIGWPQALRPRARSAPRNLSSADRFMRFDGRPTQAQLDPEEMMLEA
mmetsp:Transcript_4932/g.12708  ORF Transcript_4932/g.12708 Transcript_4932/m.12708 type:complete len:406 (-) Transcript_4932:257-1474(-)